MHWAYLWCDQGFLWQFLHLPDTSATIKLTTPSLDVPHHMLFIVFDSFNLVALSHSLIFTSSPQKRLHILIAGRRYEANQVSSVKYGSLSGNHFLTVFLYNRGPWACSEPCTHFEVFRWESNKCKNNTWAFHDMLRTSSLAELKLRGIRLNISNKRHGLPRKESHVTWQTSVFGQLCKWKAGHSGELMVPLNQYV